MKLKLNKEKYIGETRVIDERLENIYGTGEYAQTRCHIQEENRKKYIYAGILMGFLVICLFFSGGIDKFIIKNTEGNIRALSRAEETGSVPVEISGIWQGEEFKKEVVVDISSLEKKKEMEKEELMEKKGMEEEMKALDLDNMIADIVESVSSDLQGKKIILPDRLSDGTEITWHDNSQNYLLPVLLLGILLIYGIYKSRFDYIKKLETQADESVMEELPGFLNKLALLMNAGLVFGSAYERIIDEKEKIGWSKDSYFYNQLIKINENVRERNCSIQKELTDFAKRTQNKEFIRSAGIITDNINKGIMLTDKLRGESEAMWHAQRKYIEEKAKVAETKQVGPLVIILGILIVITIVPAMMSM